MPFLHRRPPSVSPAGGRLQHSRLSRWGFAITRHRTELLILAALLSAWSILPGGSGGEGRPVVVAARAMTPGDEIDTTMTRTVDAPAGLTPRDAVDPGGVDGRRLILPVAEGTIITAAMLADGSFSDRLAPGHAAVSVPLSSPNAATPVSAGDRVRVVIADASRVSERQGALGGVPATVLAVQAPEESRGPFGGGTHAARVVVSAPVEHAERIAAALAEGNVTPALILTP